MVSHQPHYTLSQIAAIVKGTLVEQHDNDLLITDLLIDSRQLFQPDTTLFFAIQSKRNDGHKYIPELISKGVKAFVVSRIPEQLPDEGVSFIVVDQPVRALQLLAMAHRRRFSIPVIGITGSNGKTVVKEWLYQLLSDDYAIVRSPKSYNSQIGVPLSVWQMNLSHQLAIFEAGISEPGEMERLQEIIQPTIGIFTNIGSAHSENFINDQQKAGEKLKLFTKVETLIYCADQSEIQTAFIRSQLQQNLRTFTWSRHQKADLRISQIDMQSNQTRISAIYQNQTLELVIPFTDEASIENSINCWCLMLLLGYGHELVSQRFRHLSPVAMRLELKDGINQCTIINDSYNSDVQSLAIALDFLNQQQKDRRKTVILSDIFQSGMSEPELYGSIARLLEARGISHLIGIGPAISRQSHQFGMQKDFFLSTGDFLTNYPISSFHNTIILLKGARLFSFEKISAILQQKLHETVLEINLNHLIQNLNYYRTLIQPGTRIMLMVKAFGYGSGGYEIAGALQFHQADYLAVAYVDEGIELRKAGITMPIMVMSPEELSFDALLLYGLEPEIYSFRVLGLLEDAIARLETPGRQVRIHLKFDTGMHRLGFSPGDAEALGRRLAAHPNIRVQSIFSHLAASDKPEHDDFTRRQIAVFDSIHQQLSAYIPYHYDRHILNSAGISRFPEAHYEMVRLGIGVYGIPVGKTQPEPLKHVVSLRSVISQIRHVPSGESIGYNRSSFTCRESVIGVVPIGYADGLPRSLSNGKGRLFIHGKPAPIIGDVCMDMCMVDLTGIDAAEGDEVIVFDESFPVTDLAADAGTIPYEILTRISRRVKRIYYQE
ncbi:MAG TPA: bifunctional UDP-N-acetylmuramoyl-tripeptide:D-alanyl-D-alanine ligase/alanine racemase [Bacteroidales bacterium]|nr:bifunctional UDP-N-acetylmuramoyl-tripeptide:D-alanyl-D-alanine ligase/alanine racemase [Bacteroidales bacterium]